MADDSWKQLLRLMGQYFNNIELYDLCFSLGIDPDELGGDHTPKSKRIQMLIRTIIQHNRYPELLQELQEQRPAIIWPEEIAQLPLVNPPIIPTPLMRPERAEYFTGRENELQKLLADLQPSSVVTLTGPGGIGKSALAAEAIWILAPDDTPPERFPDGIIIHNFNKEKRADAALASIARAFGLDPYQGGAVNAARQALSGKLVLMLLDGAEEADDLEAVLAVRDRCGVIITSRKREDAKEIRLDISPLPSAKAVKLFQSIGSYRATDIGTVKQICELVGRLPLAVKLAAKYLIQREQEAREYLDWLKKSPLTALEQGDTSQKSVEILLDKSITQLSNTAKQILWILGIMAFSSFSEGAVAVTLSLSSEETRHLLGELVNYGLLIRPKKRYLLSHALIHTYAQEKGKVSKEMIDYLGAYYDGYISEASKLAPAGYKLLDNERPHILMVIVQLVKFKQWEIAKSLVWGMEDYLHIQGYWREWKTILEQGIIVAQESGAQYDEEAFTNNLGFAYRSLGQVKESISFHELAFTLAKERNDEDGQGISLHFLGRAYLNLGQVEKAINYFDKSLTIAKKNNNREQMGIRLGSLGSAYQELGQVRRAIDLYWQALAIAKEVGRHLYVEGAWLGALGLAYIELGQFSKATDLYRQALSVAREVGDRPGEGIYLGGLGIAYYRLGQVKKAITFYDQALAIAREIDDKINEGKCIGNLGEAYRKLGHLEKAINFHRQALTIYKETGIRKGEGNTLGNLGLTYHEMGQLENARQCYHQSLAIFEEIKSPQASWIHGLIANLERPHRRLIVSIYWKLLSASRFVLRQLKND